MFSRAPSILTLLFLICVPATLATDNKDNAKRSLVSFLKIKLEDTFEENVSSLTKWLEGFNDKHLGRSEFGKLMLYEDVKPKLQIDSSRGNIKKMGMAMMPLVFHIGAASTWMVLTSIMAVKSVMIGLVLLVFKIAVSSAKVASFFTALKSDHGWSSPHHEHHNHHAVIDGAGHNHIQDNSYSPSPGYENDYRTQDSGHSHSQDSYFPSPGYEYDYHTLPAAVREEQADNPNPIKCEDLDKFPLKCE